jgi:hypothetical protein
VVRQFVQVVDELLRRILAWARGTRRATQIPADIARQLQAIDALWGDSLPTSHLPLRTAASRLHEEFRAYTDREFGRVRPEDGAPGPGWWGAVKAFALARHAIDEASAERLEPVSVLLEQGVSHAQIGLQIYGRRGQGPFVQQNGDVDVALVEKEAREPGSVVPADWVPPWHLEALARRQAQLNEQLALLDRMEAARHYDDPCTVEEMLLQGAFVQQIERAKGVSRDDVLTTAKRLGIDAIDGPGYRTGTDDSAGPESEEEFDEDTAEIADREAVKRLAIELYIQACGQISSAEIAAQLRKQGHDINTSAVAATIGHWKKRQERSAADAASAPAATAS